MKDCILTPVSQLLINHYRTNDITVRGAFKIASTPACCSNGYYHAENKGGAQQLVPIQFPPSRRFLNVNLVFQIQLYLGWKSAIVWGVVLANLWSKLLRNSENASMAGIVLGLGQALSQYLSCPCNIASDFAAPLIVLSLRLYQDYNYFTFIHTIYWLGWI